MTAAVIASAVLLAACALMFAAWRGADKDRKAAQARCAELEKSLYAAQARLDDAEQAAKIAAENRRTADEKIDALHSGDACGNAIDVLSERT